MSWRRIGLASHFSGVGGIYIVEESQTLDGIWESSRKRRRSVQEQLDTERAEMNRLSVLYEECRSLWMQGDFKRLSDALDKEGFHFFRELSEKMHELKYKADGLLDELERIDRDLREGIQCPRCDGTGHRVAEKRYERSEGQIIPVVRMQECSLCKGSGKLLPPQPV